MEVMKSFFSPPDRLMVIALRDGALNAIISSPTPHRKALKVSQRCAFFLLAVTENPLLLQENADATLLKNQTRSCRSELN